MCIEELLGEPVGLILERWSDRGCGRDDALKEVSGLISSHVGVGLGEQESIDLVYPEPLSLGWRTAESQEASFFGDDLPCATAGWQIQVEAEPDKEQCGALFNGTCSGDSCPARDAPDEDWIEGGIEHVAGDGFDGWIGTGEEGVSSGHGMIRMHRERFAVPGGESITETNRQGRGDGLPPELGCGHGRAERPKGFDREACDIPVGSESGSGGVYFSGDFIGVDGVLGILRLRAFLALGR
jgi:hypothetical protein